MAQIHRLSSNKMTVAVKDTGYHSICSVCSRRFNHNPALVGIERELDYATCNECSSRDENGVDRRRRHAVGRAGGGRDLPPFLED